MTSSPGKPDPKVAESAGSPAERASERFPRSRRLRSRTDFDELFQRGHVIVDHVLVIHGRQAISTGTGTSTGRIGISISKRVGNAPCRNRWKRLIREAYRRLAARSPGLGRLDLVVRPRRGAVAEYAAIERSLASLTARLARQLGRRERS
ncbi:MAG: ribonuclease P protein component [Aureliella sp.]